MCLLHALCVCVCFFSSSFFFLLSFLIIRAIFCLVFVYACFALYLRID